LLYDSFSFSINPVYVESGSVNLGRWVLRRFQEEVMDAVSGGKDSLLVAPTGSGKTLSLLLGRYGAVGVYPNNTLLLDQKRSINKVLLNAFDARVSYSYSVNGVDVLTLYDLGSSSLPNSDSRRVAVVLLSGKYVGYDDFVSKREVILHNIVQRFCYDSDSPYVVTLTTPDTALLIMIGMYRNFERAGYMIHNVILSALRGVPVDFVLKQDYLNVSDLGDIAQIRQCLLKYFWFIDEFHLYGAYEASGLIPVLKTYRDYVGWDEPIVLSSATPRGVLYERISSMYNLKTISPVISDTGDSSGFVRGETDVEVIHVDAPGRGKWFKVGDYLPFIVMDKMDEIKRVINMGGRVFIVTDRINQVPRIVYTLVDSGLQPECGVSIPPPVCSDKEELLLVGSESVSQGIDRENVKFGIITGHNWATLIQRFGRIGRKTNSKIIIVTPMTNNGPLSSLDGKTVSYSEFVNTVVNDFPKIEMRLPQTKEIQDVLTIRENLLEYASVVGFAHVSKPKGTLDSLSRIIVKRGNILDRIFAPIDAVSNIMLFRSSGFDVLVEYSENHSFISDVASVLRNFVVKHVGLSRYTTQLGVEKEIPKFVIDYTPGRQILLLEESQSVRENIGEELNGMITTIGELLDLGFTLCISPADNIKCELKIPPTDSVKEQVVSIIKTSNEYAEYLVYSLRAILLPIGEAINTVALLL